MMSLTYNSITAPFDQTQPLQLMDVYQFVHLFQYPIDKLYIDRFWNGINKNDWIVVDYEMLRWMGYASAEDRDNKEKYLTLLKSSKFEQPDDYDFNVAPSDHLNSNTLDETIIVRAKPFKKTLMMLRTEKADAIRDCYLLVEDILLDYVQYNAAIDKHNANVKLLESQQTIVTLQKQLEDVQIEFDISNESMSMKEYVYVLTNKRYYKQHMFKIGKSSNTKNRLISFNTGIAIADEDMFYVAKIATVDCTSLERLLHKALDNYSYRKEWFHIPHQHMLHIIKLATDQQASLCAMVNELVMSDFDHVQSIELDRFIDDPVGSLVKPVMATTSQVAKLKHIKQLREEEADKKLYPRLRYVPTALTRLRDIKNVYPTLTTRKLLARNEQFIATSKQECYHCSSIHQKDCCDDYSYKERISVRYIQNVSIV